MSRAGFRGALYANTGTVGAPVWLEIATVRDVTLNLNANDIDDTSRTTDGWRSRIAGLREWGLDFEMVYEPKDTAWGLVRVAFLNGTSLEVLVLDEDLQIDGAEGIRGTVFVTDFSREEPLEDVMANSTSMVGNGTPEWVIAAGGAVSPKDGS